MHWRIEWRKATVDIRTERLRRFGSGNLLSANLSVWVGLPAKRSETGGLPACATCPHLAEDKSPLHLARMTRPTAAPPDDPNRAARRSDPNDGNPVASIMSLYRGGADLNTLLPAMNQNYAVVKYGGQVVVAGMSQNDITFMKPEDFHRMFANCLFYQGRKRITVSERWFEWEHRRQYLGRGVVFEPGGPVEVENDMLNLWRGFGVEPKQGDWSLMQAHLFNVVCSGRREHFDYMIRWMAYRVQHPDNPVGVAVALLGAQGAGKGIVARNFGGLFGKHFAHISHGDQLTGRFNACLATACVAFLDEALWAGDKKGEGVLKALITEPMLQLEAKFRDPIMVQNRLALIVASNNDWAVPAGVGDRRWFVLNVANSYAGTGHRAYWTALYDETERGGAAAMLHDLLAMDLTGFDVRAVPQTAAKAQQQVQSFRGTTLWLHHILTEGAIGSARWGAAGLTVSTADGHRSYEEFSKQRREYQSEMKSVWSKNVLKALGPHVKETRPTIGATRVRSFQFAPLDDCRHRFANHIGAPDMAWDDPDEVPVGAAIGQTAEDVGEPGVLDPNIGFNFQREPELQAEAANPDPDGVPIAWRELAAPPHTPAGATGSAR